MENSEIYDQPSDVDALDGCVLVKGPGPLDVQLTPGAAEETSDRLLHAAMKARGQLHFGDESR